MLVVLSPCCPCTRDGADLSRAHRVHPSSELGHMASMGQGLSPATHAPALPPAAPLVPLTGAAELILLDLSHVEAAELGWSRALGEEPDSGALAQPLREPGQVAVAEEVVGVQAAAGRWGSQQPQDSSCPPHCPPGCPSPEHPKGWGHTEGDTEEPESLCAIC